MLTSFKKIIRVSFENISRNKGLFFTTTFIIVVAVSLISGLFVLRSLTDSLVNSIKDKVDISVYFVIDAPEEEIIKAKEQLSKIPEIKEVSYISREEALNIFKEKHKNDPVIMESLEEIGENPLAAHLNIKAWQASQYEQISEFLKNSPFSSIIDKIDYYQNKRIIERLFSISSTIQKISFVFIAIATILAILIAFNTVRLGILDFKREISIMRLVGASNWFIRGPFIVQGAISGILASFISLVIFALGCWCLSPKVEILVAGFNLFDYFKSNLSSIVFLQLFCGLSLGIIPSLFAIRKYLKV